jgi:hypothetical protein
MKTKWFLVLAAMCLTAVTACSNVERDPIEFYFYTTETSETDQLSLWIDDEEIGLLPYAATAPDCNTSETMGSLLHAFVAQGRHCYMAKDAAGTIRAHGYFKCKKDEKGQELRTGSGSDGMGGAELQWSCDFITMGVFE